MSNIHLAYFILHPQTNVRFIFIIHFNYFSAQFLLLCMTDLLTSQASNFSHWWWTLHFNLRCWKYQHYCVLYAIIKQKNLFSHNNHTVRVQQMWTIWIPGDGWIQVKWGCVGTENKDRWIMNQTNNNSVERFSYVTHFKKNYN